MWACTRTCVAHHWAPTPLGSCTPLRSCTCIVPRLHVCIARGSRTPLWSHAHTFVGLHERHLAHACPFACVAGHARNGAHALCTQQHVSLYAHASGRVTLGNRTVMGVRIALTRTCEHAYVPGRTTLGMLVCARFLAHVWSYACSMARGAVMRRPWPGRGVRRGAGIYDAYSNECTPSGERTGLWHSPTWTQG